MKSKHPVCKFGHSLTRENTRRIAGQTVCATCADNVSVPAPIRPEHCAPHSAIGCSICQRRSAIIAGAARLRRQQAGRAIGRANLPSIGYPCPWDVERGKPY